MAQPNLTAARRAAEAYVRTINEGRYSEVGELFADDGNWLGFNGEPQKGRRAISAFYTRFLSERKPTIRVASFVSEGDMCAIELEVKNPEMGEFRPGPLDHITVNAQGEITRLAVYAAPKRKPGA